MTKETGYDASMSQRLHTCLWVLALCACVFSTASGQQIERGNLLVATPALADTTFSETVLLVIHHDEDGSIAIMINRPTNLAPARVFPEIGTSSDYDGPLYFGGPVSTTRAFVLSRNAEPIDGSSIRIVGDVHLSGDFSVLALLTKEQLSSASVRVYAGHAQWGPAQLQAEIAAGAWTVVPGQAARIFSAEPLALWQRLVVTPGDRQIAQLQTH